MKAGKKDSKWWWQTYLSKFSLKAASWRWESERRFLVFFSAPSWRRHITSHIFLDIILNTSRKKKIVSLTHIYFPFSLQIHGIFSAFQLRMNNFTQNATKQNSCTPLSAMFYSIFFHKISGTIIGKKSLQDHWYDSTLLIKTNAKFLLFLPYGDWINATQFSKDTCTLLIVLWESCT